MVVDVEFEPTEVVVVVTLLVALAEDVVGGSYYGKKQNCYNVPGQRPGYQYG